MSSSAIANTIMPSLDSKLVPFKCISKFGHIQNVTGMLWFDKKARIRAMNTCDIFHFIAEYRPAEIFSGRQKKKGICTNVLQWTIPMVLAYIRKSYDTMYIYSTHTWGLYDTVASVFMERICYESPFSIFGLVTITFKWLEWYKSRAPILLFHNLK